MKILIKSAGFMTVGLLFLGGCGGGSTSSTASSDGTIAEINSISDVPTSVVDPSQYDLSTNTALQTSLSKSISKAAGDAAPFSRAGCETDRMKKNIIRNALMPKLILCFMQKFEEAAGGDAAGDGVFNLWKGNDEISEQAGGPGGVDTFKPRMAIKKGSTDLTFVMCNDTTKVMEFYLDTAGGVYDGYVIDKWGEGFEGRLDFNADGLPDSFTTATFTQTMVEASDFWNGFASQTLEATPNYDSVYGFYNEQGDNSYAGAVYARFDATQGTARYKQDSTGSYPAWTVQATYDNCEIVSPGECGDLDIDWLSASGWLATQCNLSGLAAGDFICFSNECVENEVCCPSLATSDTCSSPAGLDTSESFTIALLDDATHALQFGVTGTSDYAEAVAAATLQDSSTAPTIEFTSASDGIDCTESSSWDEIVFQQAPDTTECDAIQAELDDWDTGELCQILDAAASGTAGVQ
ncbi:MAG: hypothetical protein HYU98_05845 [Deltaproteobacteria bacterium]|nr:hypothetical protein [Deltaproteobacteria bacterium]